MFVRLPRVVILGWKQFSLTLAFISRFKDSHQMSGEPGFVCFNNTYVMEIFHVYKNGKEIGLQLSQYLKTRITKNWTFGYNYYSPFKVKVECSGKFKMWHYFFVSMLDYRTDICARAQSFRRHLLCPGQPWICCEDGPDVLTLLPVPHECWVRIVHTRLLDSVLYS